MLIEDGKGQGYKARVNADNRLAIESVIQTAEFQAIDVGDGYNINSGQISFSAAGTVLYIENNENQDLIVSAIDFGAGTGSTSDMGEITIERNITGGDIISDATAVAMNQNRNFGSSKTLSVTAYAGKSGGTSTGGDDIILFYHGTDARLFASTNLILPKGTNMSVTYEPNLSSGTINAYCAAICHLKSANV